MGNHDRLCPFRRAVSNWLQSILYVGRDTSTKTGTVPYCMIGATVVGNPAATVITSSFFYPPIAELWEVKAMKARRLAEEPELVKGTVFCT